MHMRQALLMLGACARGFMLNYAVYILPTHALYADMLELVITCIHNTFIEQNLTYSSQEQSTR